MIIEENLKRELKTSKSIDINPSDIQSLKNLFQKYIKLNDLIFKDQTIQNNFNEYLDDVWFNYFLVLRVTFDIFDNEKIHSIKYKHITATDPNTELFYRYNSLQNRMRFALSPFFNLLECKTRKDIKDNNTDVYEDDNDVDENEIDDDDSIEIPDTKVYHNRPLAKGSSMVIYYPQIYHSIYLAIRTYIKYCPFTYNIYIPTENDFFTWAEAKDRLRNNPSFLCTLKPEYIDALLVIGGDSAIDHFRFLCDPSHNNPNFNNYQSIRSFYRKVYAFIENSHLDYETSDSDKMIIFELFILEYLLNGTFLFHYADAFSNQSMSKIYKNNKDQIITLFCQISLIPNIFYRHFLLNLIIHSYSNELIYKNEKIYAGKKNPSLWLEKISEIICNLNEDHISQFNSLWNFYNNHKNILHKLLKQIDYQKIIKKFRIESVSKSEKYNHPGKTIQKRTPTHEELFIELTQNYHNILNKEPRK